MAHRKRSSILRALIAAAVLNLAVNCLWGADLPAFTEAAPSARPLPARRELLGLSAGILASIGQVATAIEPCKPDANNCFSTASAGKNKIAPWKWPVGNTRDDAIATLKAVVSAYPKEGQDGVDAGGWSFAVDQLGDKGYARLEFLSGIGNFARFLNGGKPFVDDFEISVGDDTVNIKSSSRVGDSDFWVNGKRINYIAAALRAKGWTAPGVSS